MKERSLKDFKTIFEIEDSYIYKIYPLGRATPFSLIVLKNGLSTVFITKTGKLINPNNWYYGILYTGPGPLFEVKNNEGLYSLANVKDLSLVNDKIWYKEKRTFSKSFPGKPGRSIISRADGLCTLINTIKFAFINKNAWYREFWKFNDDYYVVRREDGLCSLVYKSNLKLVFKDAWFYSWEETHYMYEYNNHSHFIVRNKDGNGTFISSDGKIPYPNLWFKSWAPSFLNDDVIKVLLPGKDWYTYVSKKDGSLIKPDLFFVYERRLDDEVTLICQSNNHDRCTLINNKDASFVYDDTYFDYWEVLDDKNYKVKNKYTGEWSVLSKEEGKLTFPKKWFEDIHNFNDEAYIVRREIDFTIRYTLVYKKNLSNVNKRTLWFDQIYLIGDHIYARLSDGTVKIFKNLYEFRNF